MFGSAIGTKFVEKTAAAKAYTCMVVIIHAADVPLLRTIN